MYISFAGIPSGELVKQGGFGGQFVTDFKTTYGHDPASFYSIYGAAATQLILAAIAKSDGTRKSINSAAFSGITIPADQSILGKEFGIDSDRRRDRQGHVLQPHEGQQRAVPQAVAAGQLMP